MQAKQKTPADRPPRKLRLAVQRVLRAVDKAVEAGEEARRARDEFRRLVGSDQEAKTDAS